MQKSNEPLRVYSFRLSPSDICKIDSQQGESRTARLRSLIYADTTPKQPQAPQQDTAS